MGENSILEFNNKESVSDVLNELLRDGAQQLIRQAVETDRTYAHWRFEVN